MITVCGASGERPWTVRTLSRQLHRSERLLLNEFTHRLNNEFAAAIGITSIAIARASSEDERCAMARVQHALKNFALVQHLLSLPAVPTRVDGCAYLSLLDAQRAQVSAEAALAASHAKLATDEVTVFLELGGGR
jgi:two-component sensor histidine kinase